MLTRYFFNVPSYLAAIPKRGIISLLLEYVFIHTINGILEIEIILKNIFLVMQDGECGTDSRDLLVLSQVVMQNTLYNLKQDRLMQVCIDACSLLVSSILVIVWHLH